MAGITREGFTRQYEHVAVIAHGAHPEYRVEFDAKVATQVGSDSVVEDALKIRQGSIVSVNANGEYVLGCEAGTGVNYPVPCISLKNVADPDVTTGVKGADYRTTTYSAVGGVITAIPCTAGYEIETTEFTGSTFVPGDALVPEVVSGAQTGKLVKATDPVITSGGVASTVPTLGFVSKLPRAFETHGTAAPYDYGRLGFFTNFIPAAH